MYAQTVNKYLIKNFLYLPYFSFQNNPKRDLDCVCGVGEIEVRGGGRGGVIVEGKYPCYC